MTKQIMIVGDGEKFVSALIVPNFNGLADWCKKHSVSYNGKEEAIKSEEIQAVYQKTIDKYNPQFNHVEQIKKFVLLSNEWTVESGELTPSMKMKRKVILQKYSEEIEKIYNQ